MATIRRAKGYIQYLLALAISALFSIVGKPTPTWAQETQFNYNATVFRSNFLKSNNTVWNSLGTAVYSAPSWPSQGMEIGKIAPSWPSQGMELGNRNPSWPSQGMEIGTTVAPSWPSQGMEIGKIQPSWPSQGMEIGRIYAPVLQNSAIGPLMTTRAEAITLKIQNGEATTDEENSFLLSYQNGLTLNNLAGQQRKIEELTTLVNTLQTRLNNIEGNNAPQEQ